MASTVIQQRPGPGAVLAHHEDFINRSLLDQIDTEADAEPVFSSDSETTGASMGRGLVSARNFDSSSSQSSVESQDFAYNFPMQSRAQPPARSGSPGARHLSLDFTNQNDQFVQTPQQALYNNTAMDPAEYTPFQDTEAQPQSGHFDNSTFRNNSIFGSYLPSRNRQSLAGASAAGFGNDTSAINMNPFNALPANEAYGPQLPLQSMPQQQQPGGVRGYDFANDPQTIKTNGKSLFANMDPFSAGPGLSAHQFNNNKLAQLQQQAQQQQQQQLQNFVNQSFANGMLQQQQAFGPQLNANSGSLANLGLANNIGNISITTQQEEISTIFVVGFPDDMQVSTFNMPLCLLCTETLHRSVNFRTCSRFRRASRLRH